MGYLLHQAPMEEKQLRRAASRDGVAILTLY